MDSKKEEAVVETLSSGDTKNEREIAISQSNNGINGKSWTEAIYSPTSWKDPIKSGIFLPGVPVQVTVSATKVQGRISHRVGHNIIYKIQVVHGLWTWSVEKRFQNFISLHTSLIFFKGKEHFSGMIRGLNRILDMDDDTTLPSLPRFPGKPDTMMTSPEVLEERQGALENYLNTILQCAVYRENPEMISFLEVSRLSFLSGCIKSQEGYVKKRHGDFRSGGCCKWQHCMRCQLACLSQLSTQWGRRWLLVHDTSILYVNPDTGKIKEVFLYDSETSVGAGFREAGSRKGFKLSNSSRTLVIKCFRKRVADRWVKTIQESMSLPHPGSKFVDKHIRFESFAPVRDGKAAWFVDGCDYLAAIANAIDKAKEEIFITDWWLSPELYLKRGLDREPWRLTTLLKKKAEEGVRISILLYKEVAAVLGINSMHSKRRMLQHPNIRVIRHPDHTPLPIMWAHHEKCVVIDQWTAFVGGIDLCFGRWDTHGHKLVDLGSGTSDTTDHLLDRTMSGTSLMESIRIINSSRPTVTSQAIQSVTMQLLAQHCVLDVAMAPVRFKEEEQEQDQTDNVVNTEVSVEGKKSLRKSARKVMLKVKTVRNIKRSNTQEDSEEEDDDPDGGLLSRKVTIPQHKCPDSELTWPGKDYVNWIVRDLARPELHDQDNADRQTTPRMPWHDIGLAVTGPSARDVARHFIQRWNHLKSEKLRFNDNYSYLVPKSYNIQFGGCEEDLLQCGESVRCQVLRSVSDWSGGQDKTEYSIMQGLIEAIKEAKHYVYIENQFFISYVKNGDPFSDVRNDVATAIYDRIVAAHNNNETFRVFVLLPLLPAFEGDIAGDSGSGMRTIMHYQYQSISRGEFSLINRLQLAGIKQWNKYIGFYSLRTHDLLKGIPVTELVYIHSKLCIVDDRKVICGSANINDRSLLGSRDSELCLHVEDTEFVEGKMNGKPYQCGKFAGGLRKQLFKEHLGMLDKANTNDLVDPVCDEFFDNIWNSTASTNTVLYDELFSVIPTNSIPTLKASKELQTKVRPLVETFGRDVKNKLDNIRGHLVLFPTQYLEDEDLQPATLAKEGLVPQDLWK